MRGLRTVEALGMIGCFLAGAASEWFFSALGWNLILSVGLSAVVVGLAVACIVDEVRVIAPLW